MDFETAIRGLEQGQKDALVFLGKVGVGISRERLAARRYDRYDRAFLLLDGEDSYEGVTEELPEGLCAAVRFWGSHKDASGYYQRLSEFIAGKDLKISGFSREITMIDYGITPDVSQFVTEIQISVQPV